ncbi:hypothetical protein CORC01_00154 [Colletotrichum orchidophilum]|uniref:Uncharacterized protein n=1 Tax=Colletotrichum orchidophilum TaxID=1209926 RepID=A0A1G4BTF5_9PEZI|nr:uncharacterized protein CORC01_00154 [Colletotrichum orchidophilum]OHF04683.1 hypothetical protein CORC01_00154 [Colletotrichum orchidophilum]
MRQRRLCSSLGGHYGERGGAWRPNGQNPADSQNLDRKSTACPAQCSPRWSRSVKHRLIRRAGPEVDSRSPGLRLAHRRKPSLKVTFKRYLSSIKGSSTPPPRSSTRQQDMHTLHATCLIITVPYPHRTAKHLSKTGSLRLESHATPNHCRGAFIYTSYSGSAICSSCSKAGAVSCVDYSPLGTLPACQDLAALPDDVLPLLNGAADLDGGSFSFDDILPGLSRHKTLRGLPPVDKYHTSGPDSMNYYLETSKQHSHKEWLELLPPETQKLVDVYPKAVQLALEQHPAPGCTVPNCIHTYKPIPDLDDEPFARRRS